MFVSMFVPLDRRLAAKGTFRKVRLRSKIGVALFQPVQAFADPFQLLPNLVGLGVEHLELDKAIEVLERFSRGGMGGVPRIAKVTNRVPHGPRGGLRVMQKRGHRVVRDGIAGVCTLPDHLCQNPPVGEHRRFFLDDLGRGALRQNAFPVHLEAGVQAVEIPPADPFRGLAGALSFGIYHDRGLTSSTKDAEKGGFQRGGWNGLRKGAERE